MKLISFLINTKIFLFLFFSNIFCQDINTLFEYAKNKYNTGEYDKAINSFHRIIFFDSTTTYLYESYYYLSLSYFKSNQIKKAKVYVEFSINSATNDSLKNEALFLLCYYNIFEKNYSNARYNLLNINEFNNYFSKKRDFYNGLISLKMLELDSAFKYFSRVIDSSKHNELKYYFDKMNKINKKYNPLIAKVFSMIIPGSGQMLFGNFKDGLNSFVLNGSILFLMFNVYSNISFLDGIITLLPWYLRYYQGGYENAFLQVQNKKETIINNIFMEWLRKNKNILINYNLSQK